MVSQSENTEIVQNSVDRGESLYCNVATCRVRVMV